MGVFVHTYAYRWVERRSALAFSLTLGALMLSCPTVENTWAKGVDSANDVQLTEDGHDDHRQNNSGEDDDDSGVDVGLSGLRDDIRVGIEVPVLGDDPMSPFFEALSQLEAKRRDKVRILHYGDSHTAADFLTTAIRRGLQARFGDGGRGFVLLGKPWKSYRPKDVEVTATGQWESERIVLNADPVTLDGYYGLAGVTTQTTEPFAKSTVRTSLDTPFGRTASTFDLFYMVQPGGGRIQVYVDGASKGSVSTNGDRLRTGFFKAKVKEGAHTFEVRTTGNGPVRLFGAAVESERGLVYDSLGVNGGFFYTPHRWNEAELQRQIERRHPDLLVTMYGTNESGSKSITPESYKEKVMTTMSRFMAGAKEASCLMLGPPDRTSPNGEGDRITWIIQVQREVAAEIGCGFIDLREIMGGPGAHQAWENMSPPMAQTDGVHLTVKGYMYLGERIAAEVLTAYDESKK